MKTDIILVRKRKEPNPKASGLFRDYEKVFSTTIAQILNLSIKDEFILNPSAYLGSPADRKSAFSHPAYNSWREKDLPCYEVKVKDYVVMKSVKGEDGKEIPKEVQVILLTEDERDFAPC